MAANAGKKDDKTKQGCTGCLVIIGITWSIWSYSLTMFTMGAMIAAVLITSAVLYAIKNQPVTSSLLGTTAAALTILAPIMMHRSTRSRREWQTATGKARISGQRDKDE